MLDSKFTVNVNHQLDEIVWEGQDLINGTMSFDINGFVTMLQLGYRIDGSSGSLTGLKLAISMKMVQMKRLLNYELDTSSLIKELIIHFLQRESKVW